MSENNVYTDLSMDSTRLEILYQVLRAANSSLEPEQVCVQVVHTLAELGGYAIVSASLKHGSQFEMAARVGWPEGTSAELTKGIYGRAIHTGLPQFVPDVSLDPDYTCTREDIAGEICVPIKADGEMVGLLSVGSTADLPLTVQDYQLVVALADQIGLVIRNAGLYQKQQVMLSTLLQVTPDVIIFKDSNHRFLACSEEKCRHHGLMMEEMIGLSDTQLFPPQQAESFRAEEDEVMRTGQPLTAEHLLDLHVGLRWYEAIKTPLYNSQGDVIGILCTERDITERKQAEAALQESQRTLSTLMSNLPGLVYRCFNDPEWTMTFVSEGCQELTGYQPDDLIHNNRASFAALIHPEDRQRVWDHIQTMISNGQPFQLMYRITTASGQEKWVWEQGRCVFSSAGDLLFLEGFITDITQQRRNEEALRISLKEKQVLLQEVHHRVGNNLQVISSLLSLQAEHLEDRESAEIFHQSRDRIRSMALIHERLYRSKDLSRISPGEYLETLIIHLFNIYGAAARDIHCELQIVDVPLDLNTAISVGMIVNELVSNALEHAFADGRAGKIRISLASGEGNILCLTVSDNGVGFPLHFDIDDVSSMGLQLTNVLAQQVGGTLELKQDQGTAFQVTFQNRVLSEGCARGQSVS